MSAQSPHAQAVFPPNLVLLLCALIWGLAFAAQKWGMGATMGPMLFVALRFALALLTMAVALCVQRLLWLKGSAVWRAGFHAGPTAPRIWPTRREWLSGSFLAVFFLIGMLSQQMGLVHTSVANSAFITGLYVVLVPLLALVHGHKTGLPMAGAIFLAAAGVYFLCFPSGGGLNWQQLNRGDALTLLCACAWAVHVFYVSKLGHWGGAMRIVAVQFFWTALCAGLAAWRFEDLAQAQIAPAWFALVYTGVFSGGLAFFLQIYGQKYAHPNVAAVILSSEVLFGCLAGWLFLGEVLGLRAWLGGALMLAAMLLAQIGTQESTPPNPVGIQ